MKSQHIEILFLNHFKQKFIIETSRKFLDIKKYKSNDDDDLKIWFEQKMK